MKQAKECAHCRTPFMGPRNKHYCSPRCKGEAFRQGKAHPAPESAPPQLVASLTPPTPPLPSSTSLVPPPLARGEVISNRHQVANQSKLLDHDLAVRKLAMEETALWRAHEEKDRCRAHEETMARFQAESQSRPQAPPTPAVGDLSPKRTTPLVEWAHFPLGIRRQYQGLVQAALGLTPASMRAGGGRQWLAEYGVFMGSVGSIIAHQRIPMVAHKPFVWLAELAQHLEADPPRGPAEPEELADDLRQQLQQACL